MLSVGLYIPQHPSCTPHGLCNPPGTGGLVLYGRYKLGWYCQGLGWCLGSHLAGSLCYFWLPGCLPFWSLRGSFRKCQSPFLGWEHSLKDWCCWGGGHDSGLGPP